LERERGTNYKLEFKYKGVDYMVCGKDYEEIEEIGNEIEKGIKSDFQVSYLGMIQLTCY
jgi:hypothetical protein